MKQCKTVKERINLRSILKENGCIEWTGAKLPSGHGAIYYNGHVLKVHRALYIETYGKLDSKTVVRHICNNAACVNLNHLKPGTQAENINDTVLAGNHGMKKKTNCKYGHPYDEKNTRVRYGRRWCKCCDAIRSKKRYHEIKRLKNG
jgi:hypothetical protein